MRGRTRNPKLWLGLFVVWFGVLWFLSSRTGTIQELPDIPFSDKVAHFGYFFGGGGLLSAWLFTRKNGRPDWKLLFITVAAAFALIGAIDEYHQTFTPGRSGNDPFDWLADVSGGLAGALVFRYVGPRLRCLSDRSSSG